MQELLWRQTIKKHRMDRIMGGAGVVIIGFSGGADSSCLLHLMIDWCRENGVKLSAAHINHMIRGEEADSDEAFCKRICDSLGVPFYSLRADVPALANESGRGIEETARDVRYRFFDELSLELTGKADGAAIVTAHNAGDNLETVIFNMLRGTGIHGLCGIDPVRDGRYLRPLIADSGESIRRWCEENGVEYVTDSTNIDTEYTRNHIRHNIVGEIKKICPDPTRAISRMTELLRQDEDYLDSAADAYMKDGDTSVSRDELRSMHPAISSRVLRHLYSNVKRDSSTLGEVHIRALSELACSVAAHARLSLPGNITAVIERETVSMTADAGTDEAKSMPRGAVFTYPKDGAIFENSLCKLTFSPIEHIRHESNREKDENIYKLSILTTLRFDKIKGVLTVRYREAGDTYRYGGMTRRVKKLLSDKKMALNERELIPVLCDGEGIVWIPGFPPRDGLGYTGEGEPLYISCEKK